MEWEGVDSENGDDWKGVPVKIIITYKSFD
jgi:hypothetical protein